MRNIFKESILKISNKFNQKGHLFHTKNQLQKSSKNNKINAFVVKIKN